MPMTDIARTMGHRSPIVRLGLRFNGTDLPYYAQLFAAHCPYLKELVCTTANMSYHFGYAGVVRQLLRARARMAEGHVATTHRRPLLAWLTSSAPLPLVSRLLPYLAHVGEHPLPQWEAS